MVGPPVTGGSEHTDYYLLNELLIEEQRAFRRRVRDPMDREGAPVGNPYRAARRRRSRVRCCRKW
ncbi:hypothetical protein ACIRP2_20930 [Streptomyces sp. NPDC101194]|uniref:hypothetical protein n=1 Tax=Streptomyces sp. NPDC101194 TaxID=3366127 RepID=UPI0038196E87